jgi:hypothetical protein
MLLAVAVEVEVVGITPTTLLLIQVVREVREVLEEAVAQVITFPIIQET